MEKEVSEAERRVSIKKTYSEKIALLLKRDVDEKELYSVIRLFFADFLKLEYEFTYEELSQELNKIFLKQALKQRIDKMLEDLSWLEYMPDHELSQSEKKTILNDFKDLIEQLILDLEDTPGKVSFLDKLFGKQKVEEKASDISGLKQDLTPESLPELDIPDVNKKNQELLSELHNEMIKNEETKQAFGDFINKADGVSNNLLLFTPPEEEIASKRVRKDVTKKSISVKNIPASTANDMFKNSDLDNLPDLPGIPAGPENLLNITQKTVQSSSKEISSIGPSLLTEDNSPVMVELKELISQSYNLFFSRDVESAKMKYMDALSIYNKFDYDNKTKTYLDLYDLYKKLK